MENETRKVEETIRELEALIGCFDGMKENLRKEEVSILFSQISKMNNKMRYDVVNHVNRLGFSLLQKAISKGYTELFEALLENGANLYHVYTVKDKSNIIRIQHKSIIEYYLTLRQDSSGIKAFAEEKKIMMETVIGILDNISNSGFDAKVRAEIINVISKMQQEPYDEQEKEWGKDSIAIFNNLKSKCEKEMIDRGFKVVKVATVEENSLGIWSSIGAFWDNLTSSRKQNSDSSKSSNPPNLRESFNGEEEKEGIKQRDNPLLPEQRANNSAADEDVDVTINEDKSHKLRHRKPHQKENPEDQKGVKI